MKASFEFILTKKCNLNCDYCFEKDSPLLEIENEDLNMNNISHFINNILALRKINALEVVFSGGEPLIKFELLKSILNFLYIQHSNLKITAIVLTNGLLLDKNKINYLNAHNVRVKLSISNGETNINKKYVRNSIIKKTRYINNMGVTLVVLPNTISSLFQSIKNLHKKGIKRFYLNFEVIFSEWSREKLIILKNQLKKINDFYLKHRGHLFIDFLEKRVGCKHFPCYESCKHSFRFVIMPNGNVLPCLVGIMQSTHKLYRNLKYGSINNMKKIKLSDFNKKRIAILRYFLKFDKYLCYKKSAYEQLLIINKFLVSAYEYVKPKKIIHNYFHQINIILTRRCNLRCSFCKVLKKNIRADTKDLIKFLDRYQKFKAIGTLKFLGGEPLLEWRSLKEILKKYNHQIKFEINTNAKLLNREKINFLKGISNCNLVLSFDYEKWGVKEFVGHFNSLKLGDLDQVSINIVVFPMLIRKLIKEIDQIFKLDIREFRIMPSFYTIWKSKQLKELNILLKKISLFKQKGICIQNRHFAYLNNFLVNNHITIDSNGDIFFSDAILLNMFAPIKEKLRISNIKNKKNMDELKTIFDNDNVLLKKFQMMQRYLHNFKVEFDTNLVLYNTFKKHLG